MPRPSRTVDRIQEVTLTAENRAAREIARVYNQARRELVATLLERWTGSTALRPQDAIDLLRRLNLLDQVNARLLQLERETGLILRDVVTSSTERALDNVNRELRMLPTELRTDVRPFSRINTQMAERFVPLVLDNAGQAAQTLGMTIRRELQAGLLQGESFPNLVSRLMAADSGAFARGRNSAVLAARRTVITAENAAKQEYYEQTKRDIPEVKKQAIAVVQSRTTDCCLRVHGQIVDVDEPFTLTGTPRFADRMQHPSFHWNCRTAVGMYHPSFESGGLTTANMRSSAQAELRRRREAA